MRRVLMMGGLSLLLLIGVLAVARQQEPLPPWIYFQRNKQLHRVTWDGSREETLPIKDVSLQSASPDGKWLLTVSNELGNYRLSGINLTEMHWLPQLQSTTWSPDSHKIASTVGNLSIYDLETSRWTALDVPTQTEYFLRWSPDGEWLLYGAEFDGQLGLFRVHVHSGDFQQYEGAQNVTGMVWSSDGEWIAFSSVSKPHQTQDIYSMHPDGSAMQNLTNTPDHSEILINQGSDGWLFYVADSFVYRMRFDGEAVKRLFEFPNFYNMAFFYDDWIVFSEINSYNLFRYNHTNDTIVQLTNTSLDDTQPHIIPPTDLNWHPTTLTLGAALIFGAAAITNLHRRRMI